MSAAVLTAGLVLYLYKTEGAWKIGDGLFLAGLLFLVIGCWNLVRWMGLFDFTVYGYKKLIHHMEATRKNAPAMEPMPSYVDYLKQPKVIPSAGEPLLTAVVLVAAERFDNGGSFDRRGCFCSPVFLLGVRTSGTLHKPVKNLRLLDFLLRCRVATADDRHIETAAKQSGRSRKLSFLVGFGAKPQIVL